MDESYKIIDLGIITLEWPTALFTLVVFLVVIYLMNELLFKPVINNLENRKEFIKQNQEKHAEVSQENDRLTKEISDTKTKYWDELRLRRREIIREAELAANQKFQEKQKVSRRNIEKERESLKNKLNSLIPDSKSYFEEIQDTLNKKYF